MAAGFPVPPHRISAGLVSAKKSQPKLGASMRDDLVSKALLARLAQASNELVQALGGNAEVARLTALSPGHISKCCSPDYPELLPLALVAALEVRARAQPVTRVLADFGGHALVSLADEDQPKADDLNAPLIGMVRTSAEAAATLAASLSDGNLTGHEAREVMSKIGQAQEALSATGRVVALRLPQGRER